jgi:hypothetical protein
MQLETKNNMNETIKKMREYLQLKDDWYISKQLDILEKQIQLEITKAELKQVTELNKFINK